MILDQKLNLLYSKILFLGDYKMHFDEQPMSRKIIENGQEVSLGCTDKALKKSSLR